MDGHHLSKSVFFLAEIKGRLAAFHDAFDGVACRRHVDRAFASDCSTRLVTRGAVIAPSDQLGIAIHNEVRIVACEYELAFLLRTPDLLDDIQHHRIVKVHRSSCTAATARSWKPPAASTRASRTNSMPWWSGAAPVAAWSCLLGKFAKAGRRSATTSKSSRAANPANLTYTPRVCIV